MGKDKKILGLYIMVFVCMAICFAYFIWWLSPQKLIPTFGDFIGSWRIGAYTLRGIDPFQLNETNMIAEIGAVPENFPSTPWSCSLGNLFYAGFLPLNFAKVYLLVLYLLVCLISVFIIRWFACHNSYLLSYLPAPARLPSLVMTTSPL